MRSSRRRSGGLSQSLLSFWNPLLEPLQKRTKHILSEAALRLKMFVGKPFWMMGCPSMRSDSSSHFSVVVCPAVP